MKVLEHAPEPARGFELFELSVHLGPNASPWVSASSRIGVVHGVPRGGDDSPSLERLLDLVYDYRDAIHFAEPAPAPELAHLLETMVFGAPEIRDLFHATRGAAADRGRQVLVRILASPHLAALPWELLPDPLQNGGNESRYLALAPDAHVARLARGRTYPTPTELLQPPLNLLVMLSSPASRDPRDDSLPFDIFEVKQSLLAELKPLEDAGLLVIDVEDRPSLENLRRRVGSRRRGYHIFHYVGHAEPDRLILENESGLSETQDSVRLAEIMRLCPDLRLMVFAGCETARAAGDPMSLDAGAAVGWKDLLSMADRCVQHVCPAVIGMQAVLPFRTERLFTRFFYQGLATGYSMAESVRLARGATRGDRRVGGDLLDWSVPVLFLGGTDTGPLVVRPTEIARRRPAPRRDLKLGLRQGDICFFARDVALRQAVDVLLGRTPERVLLVTGSPGSGKTALVDRALEELEHDRDRAEGGGATGQVLYVGLGRLAPELAGAVAAEREDDARFHAKAEAFSADAPLDRLCGLVDELLRQDGSGAAPRDPGWTPRDRWDRLVEALTRTPFIVALDDADLFDEVESACLVRFAREWLVRHIGDVERKEGAPPIEQLERLLAWLRGDGMGAKGIRGNGIGLDELDALVETLDLAADPRLLKATWRAVASVVQDALDSLDADNPTFAAFVGRTRTEAEGLDREGLLRLLRSSTACRASLDGALRTLSDRRSRSRIVICTAESPGGLLGASPEKVFEMRVGRLTWKETWRWIRRNLPGLVAFGEEYLFGLWSRLGTDLDRWEKLERAVIASRSGGVDMKRLVDEVAPRASTSQSRPRRRGERPLRIAAAGTCLGPPARVAEAIARLANVYGIGGRVVVDSSDAGALAVLVEQESPFASGSSVSDADIFSWLNRVLAQQPDILLLDCFGLGSLSDAAPQQRIFQRIAHRTLVIAAGGNKTGISPAPGKVVIPAALPEVLSVGPARADGTLQPYAICDPRRRKPDVFMQDRLETTALYRALDFERIRSEGGIEGDEVPTEGSSFAALHATVAAVLVWSLQPLLSPRGIRRLLLEAARPLAGRYQRWAKWLRLEDAVALARKRVIIGALVGGPCSLQTLSAITGLEVPAIWDTIEELLEEGSIIRLSRARIERFALKPREAAAAVRARHAASPRSRAGRASAGRTAPPGRRRG